MLDSDMSICRPIYRSRGAQNTHDPKKIQLQLFSYCKYSSRIIIILRQKTHIHANPAYGVYISQLGRYARICTSKVDFMNRLLGLPLRLRQQAFETNLLQKSFNKFFNRHGLIVVKYGATLREVRLAIQA